MKEQLFTNESEKEKFDQIMADTDKARISKEKAEKKKLRKNKLLLIECLHV